MDLQVKIFVGRNIKWVRIFLIVGVFLLIKWPILSSQTTIYKSLSFKNQKEIDCFSALYQGDIIINGKVEIISQPPGAIKNIDSLYQIVGVNSSIEIQGNDSLLHLRGLRNLRYVGNNFLLKRNNHLHGDKRHHTSFEKLNVIGGDLVLN